MIDPIAQRVQQLPDSALEPALLLCFSVEATPVGLIPALLQRLGPERLAHAMETPGIEGIALLSHCIDEGRIDPAMSDVLLRLLGDRLDDCMEAANLVLSYTEHVH